MKTGMLWQDSREPKEAIMAAMAYYKAKYGREPNTCHVNPHTLQGQVPSINLVPDQYIMKGCYWLGIVE